MMDEYGLMEFSDRFRDTRQLERDYLLNLLLHEIYSVFANELVFKGGTALKYFYSLNRFSEDADFSYVPSAAVPDRKSLEEKMKTVLKNFSSQYQIMETEHRTSKLRDRIIGINFEIRVKGPFNARSKQLQNMKIDISLRDDLIDKPDIKYLSPIYPDLATFSVPVMQIDEILSEKLSAIVERTKMRDVYDTYYLLVVRNIRYDEKLLKEKMRRRNESFDKERLAKKLEDAKDRMKWRSELAYIVNQLPDNLKVVSELEEAMGIVHD